MAEILMALEKAREELEKALDKARGEGREDEPFFESLANAYAEIYRAFGLMRAYGKVDPERYEAIKGDIFKTG
ncbi:TPA: hypothetical protein EYP44_03430 [Candidatus Bathyarchaeota archaeon]|nr:hypothetical protein [Candidatus Bathyarchaeota archaeon]